MKNVKSKLTLAGPLYRGSEIRAPIFLFYAFNKWELWDFEPLPILTNT